MNVCTDLFPTRTSLKRLEPIGIGSAQMESLRSYFCRLATVHSMSMAELLAFLDPELLRHSPSCERRLLGKPRANAFNNESHLAGLIKKHNRVSGLRYLALEPFKQSVLGHMGMYKRQASWCPTTYADQKNCHELAAWRLTVLDYCPTHQTKLASNCPTCRRRVKGVSTTNIFHCPNCRQHLGVIPSAKKLAITDIPSPWQWAVSREVVAWIARLPTLAPRDNAELPALVHHLRTLCKGGTFAEFSARLNLPPTGLNNLLYGASRRPSLALWLRLSLGTGVALADLLSSAPVHSLKRSFEPIDADSIPILRGKASHQDTAELIRKFAASITTGRVSVRQLFLRFNSSYAALHKHCPDVIQKIREINERDASYRSITKKVYLRGRLEECARNLEERGHFPSRNKLMREMGTYQFEQAERIFSGVYAKADD